jgi:hypothetical protein
MLTVTNTAGRSVMPKGLLFLLIMIAVIIVYTIAKVVSYNRLSQKQWEQVDKSKLKEWDDDDSWD